MYLDYIVFEKPDVLSENFDELKLPYSSIFFAETSHLFPTYKCLQNDVWDFFYFVYILSYLQKLKKDLVSTHSFLHFY